MSSSIVFIKMQRRKLLKIKLRSLQPVFTNPIVTEVKPVTDFYEAEDYHQIM
jgi:peptide-methionine (S)-S-oxide reductase